VSLRWLLGFITDLYADLPDNFFFQVRTETEALIIYALESLSMRCSVSSVRKQTSSGYGLLWMYQVGKSSHSMWDPGVG